MDPFVASLCAVRSCLMPQIKDTKDSECFETATSQKAWALKILCVFHMVPFQIFKCHFPLHVPVISKSFVNLLLCFVLSDAHRPRPVEELSS